MISVYRKYRIAIWIGAAVASVAAYVTSNAVESRLARIRLEAEFEPAIRNMREEILVAADATLFYVANHIAALGSRVTGTTSATASLIARQFGLDEVNFIDTNGVITATTHARQLGYYLGADHDPEKAAGYLCLLTNALWYTQPPRQSVATDTIYRKFCGVRLPDGALQLGIDFSRLSRDMRQHFAGIAVDWDIASHGWYILVDPATGTVVSDGNPKSEYTPGSAEPAPKLADLGISDGTLSAAGDKTFRATVSGVPSLCRSFLVPESGLRVVVVLPESIMQRSRRASVATMTFLLLAVIFVATIVGLRLVTLRERAEEKRQAEEKRRAEDLALAQSIQTTSIPDVFPPFPQIADRVDIFARMAPAREVGGDFYDFYFVGSTHIAAVIADVSGKGIPAAMFMMRAKATINDCLVAGGKDLATAIAVANDRLADGNDASMFVTAWIGLLDIETGRIEYVNCGHNPPLVRRGGTSVETLAEVSGPPLAAFGGVSYQTQTTTLLPGETIYLYTDGITEAQATSGDMFGDDRLAKTLADANGTSADVCGAVAQAVTAFAAGMPQADDITMLAIGYRQARKSFPSTAEGVSAATAYARGFCDDPNAAVIVDEIVSNIVRCSGSPTFELGYGVADGRRQFVFTDAGKPFNPLDVPEPDVTAPAEKRAIGGLGIFLVKKMSERVAYSRAGDRNVLTVVLPPGQAPSTR